MYIHIEFNYIGARIVPLISLHGGGGGNGSKANI